MKSINYLIIGLIISLVGVLLLNGMHDLRFLGVCVLGIILMHIACLKVRDE